MGESFQQHAMSFALDHYKVADPPKNPAEFAATARVFLEFLHHDRRAVDVPICRQDALYAALQYHKLADRSAEPAEVVKTAETLLEFFEPTKAPHIGLLRRLTGKHHAFPPVPVGQAAVRSISGFHP